MNLKWLAEIVHSNPAWLNPKTYMPNLEFLDYLSECPGFSMDPCTACDELLK